MPHTRSAKKQLRKIRKRRLHNRTVMKSVRTEIKNFLEVSTKGTLDEMKKELVVVVKKLDKAAAKRVVHPNLAARKKSQLAKMVHKKEMAGKAAPSGAK